MRTTEIILAFLLALASQTGGVSGQAGPCQNYKVLKDWRRSTGYTVKSPEAPLCDINLEKGRWYLFNSSAGNKMPETCPQRKQCGTLAPIWLRGGHPTAVGRVEMREACAHFETGGKGSNCCQRSGYIGVVNCGTYFVYALVPTPACPMAYCAGELETCPSGQYSATGLPPCKKDAHPKMTTSPTLDGPELLDDGTKYRFTCHITLDEQDPEQAFEVHWVTAGHDDTPLKQEVVDEPNRAAYLEGADMKGHYGAEIGCRVRAFYKRFPDEAKSPWFRSNGYWAGVKAEPPHLVVSEAEGSQTVTVTSTVPVTCDWDYRQAKCCINIRLSAQNNVAFEHECETPICTEDWDPALKTAKITFPVKAARDQMPQSADQQLVLRFESEDLAAVGINNPNTVQLTVKDAPTATCTAYGDPHIRSIDQHQYEYHLYLLGDFTFFINPERHFEVQIRTWACASGVTCICAAAIREKDDIIRVDACDEWAVRGNSAATPQVSVVRPLREGTTVWQSSDGRNTYIYLPSSSEIKLEARSFFAGGYLDITMTIPAIDKGLGRGICGTFDGNPSNELTHRNGYVDPVCNGGGFCVPHDFMESWRATHSLFKDAEVPAPLDELDIYKYCVCDDKNGQTFINCTARADITGKKMQCTSTDNCMKKDLNQGDWSVNLDADTVNVDTDEIVDSAYDPSNYPDFQPKVLSWPTPSGISENDARDKCQHALETSQMWRECAQNQAAPLIDIESCKIDIQVTDSYDFLDSFIDGFTTNCQLKLAEDPSNFVTNAAGENVLKPELSTDVCSTACLQHGSCGQNGKCNCNPGYKGDTCQLIATLGPQLLRIRGSAFCDIRSHACQRVYIDASNLEQTDLLACKVQEILPDGSLSTDRANMMQEAEFITNIKLACDIPDARVKSDRSVKQFVISATTDGVLYGNSTTLTVYDSLCQNCTQDGCQQLPDTCLIKDLCYADGDLNPNDASQMCITAETTTQWIDAHPKMTTSPTLDGPELLDGGTKYRFTCHITFDGEDPEQAFEVHWVTAGHDDTPFKQEVVDEPNRAAYLEGADMTGHYGAEIACRVRAFYKRFPVEAKGPWFRSNGYWAGVKAEPLQLEVSEAEGSQTVTVTSTVPVTCGWDYLQTKCCINIRLSAQNNVAFEHECEKPICTEDWDQALKTAKITFDVKAARDQMPQSADQQLVLRFESEDPASVGVNNPNTVQLTVKDAPTATCNAYGDPHIRSIDQHQYEYHLFLLGDFTFFINPERHFEVQIRTWACASGVTCICAVAIREKDDIIRVGACDEWAVRGNSAATPQVSVARPLSEGTTVWQSSDGRNTYIYLPSSSEIKLEARGSYLDITMTIPAIDKGHGRGVCGTFDGNPSNELTHRNGYVDPVCNGGGNCVPHDFMESWRATQSLFKDAELPEPLNELDIYKYCVCDDKNGEKFINCTARADITGKKMQCTSTDNCKKKDLNQGDWSGKLDADTVNVDTDEIVDSAYDPNNYPDFQPKVLSWPTPSGISENDARDKCQHALETSQMWGKCAQNQTAPLIDIESCKIDILVTDSYDFLDSFIDGFTTNCQLKLAEDRSNFVTNAAGENVLKPELSTDVCSTACLQHGSCGQNGKCNCNPGYKGDTCQLIATLGPQLLRIRGSAFCDIRSHACQRVYIDASNLEQTDLLACKVQEILPDGSLSTDRANMMQEAEFITNIKLACDIPDARVKSDRSVKQFVISATTDGVLYGNSTTLTVYDSLCQNCTQDGCQQLPDTCLIKDLCYADSDLNPNDASQMCITAENTTQWIQVYPRFTVDLSRPDSCIRIACSVNTSDTNPNARYRVSWYVDGQMVPDTAEQELTAGTTVMAFNRLVLPGVGHVTCKVRSYYTDRYINSSYIESSIVDLADSSPYPIISTVRLSGPDASSAMVCTVNTTDTSPDARYKVSWYVDGQIYTLDRELSLSVGRTDAVYNRADLPFAGLLTCKMRSYYAGVQVFSPNVISNALDLNLVPGK